MIVSRTSVIFSGAPCFDWIASSSAGSGAGRPSMMTAFDETAGSTWAAAAGSCARAGAASEASSSTVAGTARRVRTLEGPPHAEVDGERIRAVLREPPAEAIRLVVLEDDDLLAARRRAERARERQVGPSRQPLSGEQPRRRRQRTRLGADARRDLHVVDAERLLHRAPDRAGDAAGEDAQQADLQQLLFPLRRRLGSQPAATRRGES